MSREETLVEMAKRMCLEYYNRGCKGCDVKKIRDKDGEQWCIPHYMAYVRTASEQLAAVENWAEQHPVRTYMDVLLERVPNARPYENGITNICRQYIFGGKCPYHPSSSKCVDCWNEPYKEDEP